MMTGATPIVGNLHMLTHTHTIRMCVPSGDEKPFANRQSPWWIDTWRIIPLIVTGFHNPSDRGCPHKGLGYPIYKWVK